MALNAKVGSFTVTTGGAGTTFVESGFGFQPTCVIFWWNGANGAVSASAVSHFFGFGFATGTSSRRAYGSRVQNAAATSDTQRIRRNDACVATVTTGIGTDGLLDLQSFDSGGFTVVVDDAFSAAMTVCYLALGGDLDASHVAIVDVLEPGSTGVQNITSLSFQPRALIGFSIAGTAWNASASAARFALGFATEASSGRQVALAGQSTDVAGTTDTDGYGYDNEFLVRDPSGGTLNARAQFNGFLSNGFSLNWLEVASLNNIYAVLALGGGSWACRTGLTRTDGNLISFTGLGFTPVCGLVGSACRATSTQDVSTGDDHLSVGGFTGTNQNAVGYIDVDNLAAVSDVAISLITDGVYTNLDSSPSRVGQMDRSGLSSGQVDFVMSNPDPSQALFGTLVGGDNPVSAVTPFTEEILRIEV